MSYYQVILKLRSPDASALQILTDASERDIVSKIVKPYKKGDSIFHNSTIIDHNDIERITIILTTEKNKVEREKLHIESLKRIDELNRQSNSLVRISIGSGYDPEDILKAGKDVTENYIKGPPGYGKLGALQKFIYNPWVITIGTGLIIAAVVAWRNWN